MLKTADNPQPNYGSTGSGGDGATGQVEEALLPPFLDPGIAAGGAVNLIVSQAPASTLSDSVCAGDLANCLINGSSGQQPGSA